LIKKLQKKKFDLVYDAHRSLRSIWIVWNLTRFGFHKTPKVWLIKKRSLQRSILINFKLNFLKNTPSQRQHLLLPLQNQTSLVLNNHTELFPDQNTVMQIKNFLNKNNLLQKKYIAIGASASYPLKRWPLKYFQELISKLIKQDCPVVLVGGANEPENTKLEHDFSGKVINAAGKFTPLESAELLRHARIVVTNDTSISHLAEAMQTPAIVFFGATVREFGYPPFLKESTIMETKEKLSCRPCSRDGRGRCSNPDNLRCLTSITPEMVLSIIPQLNNQNSEKLN
jgi:heptosyltransferase-2